ncbi:uncharacterized protein MONOS_12022 [Monocercomonoides exilis]|uniref:uncharacterized protein n=1 Tax=Monocercomonoides exilis TaxID=2049356 RepID=UPI00355A290C|nr:hypothetical protein MONOS_12022 [Monocercomonoides exilis]|eukprot:MONOS_12022.1-p1 / transcript=MONOS_12022.1 / gene=MONOS_12022 / organism=Monocercomonoides_exilis_PA203 / gene_product=unspecified product / transcript_product=unspecified product / location=Mono_scaffold00637:10675-11883(-) / protein_length=197 / sequence_SO=supercontig / SO=protein_coding / is_pseudo=false
MPSPSSLYSSSSSSSSSSSKSTTDSRSEAMSVMKTEPEMSFDSTSRFSSEYSFHEASEDEKDEENDEANDFSDDSDYPPHARQSAERDVRMDFGSTCIFRTNQIGYGQYGEEEEEKEKEEKKEENKGKTEKGLTYITPKGAQGMRMKKEQRAPFIHKIDHKRGTSTSSSLASFDKPDTNKSEKSSLLLVMKAIVII